MGQESNAGEPKVLILATLSGGYAGADSVGQAHAEYATNTYILPVVCPAMFPEEFYIESFERGIDAILVMFSGTDCPYKGGAERTAQIINKDPGQRAVGRDRARCCGDRCRAFGAGSSFLTSGGEAWLPEQLKLTRLSSEAVSQGCNPRSTWPIKAIRWRWWRSSPVSVAR